MNLFAKLKAREASGAPIRIGVIGCGKFTSMFLAQVPRTPGLHVAAIADLAPERARANLARIGWEAERSAASGLDDAIARRATWLVEDAMAMVADQRLDVVIEATGHPAAGIAHARAAVAAGKHIVMVNVEADALAGPALAAEAAKAGVVYSLAYGDQPALVCELVDTLRAAGFTVTAAGKGTKYLPLSCLDARDGLGPLRAEPRGGGSGRDEPADVQLLPRRDQERHRDGRGRQRHRPRGAPGRAALPALRRR